MMKFVASNLRELKELSFSIAKPISVCYPTRNYTETFHPSSYAKCELCYAIKNGICVFVHGGIVYCIPKMMNVENILLTSGFRHTNMTVPFSDWDYPVKDEKYWNGLIRLADSERKKFFREELECSSKKHGYTSIPRSLLEKCSEISSEEMAIRYLKSGGLAAYPITKTYCSECYRKIGHYYVDKNICTFVYINGKTYITHNWEVVRALQKAGFKEAKY